VSDRTRVAIAGAGTIATVHALAVAALPGVEVVAVASRSDVRARELAARVGARATSYEDLPSGADLVVIATPPGTHTALALHALRSGAAALVEKPLCATLAQADELLTADARGTRICYAENLLFAPITRAALAQVGSIGPLQHLEVRSLQGRPTWGDFLTDGWGGGVLFDLGVHPLALACVAALPSRPVAVRARLEGGADVPVDLWSEVHLEFDSGLTARIEASWRATEPVWDLQAASADGVVRLELLPHLDLERNGEQLPLEPLPPLPVGIDAPQVRQYGYLDQIAATTTALTAGVQMPLGAAFGRDLLEIVCAAYTSASAGGESVPVPFSGNRHLTPLDLWRGGRS